MVDLTLLRKLAKQSHYQDLYILCKDLHMQFFESSTHPTHIQLLFLKYVSFYYSIFMDISLGDVSEVVLENDIYEDSYSMYKNRKDKKSCRNTPKRDREDSSSRTNKWLFKSPRE